jgi:hypothetical protein
MVEVGEGDGKWNEEERRREEERSSGGRNVKKASRTFNVHTAHFLPHHDFVMIIG